jgi:hypothetical protein
LDLKIILCSTPIDLKTFLRSKGKNEMVAIEAARIICENERLYEQDIPYAVSGMEAFCL